MPHSGVKLLSKVGPLLFLGGALEVGFLGLLALEDWRGHLGWFLGIALVCFLPFVAVVRIVRKRPEGAPFDAILVLGFAAMFRATLLPTPPTLSDDIFRYVWEGRVQLHGFNPYRLAPDSPELAPLRDEIYDAVNHRSIPAIYPPVSQVFVRFVAACGESVVLMKASLIAVDLLCVAVLILLLRFRRRPALAAALYGWNPLVVIEVAGSGHNEPLALVLLLLALLFLDRARSGMGGVVSLTLAGLAKVVPFLLVPVLLLRISRKIHWLWLPALVIVCYLPFADAGTALFQAAGEYADRWRHNDFLFAGVLSVVRTVVGDSDPQLVQRVSKGIVAIVFLGVSVVLFFRRTDSVRAVQLLLGLLIALSPTVHPWYLLWTIPWLAFYQSPAWIYLSASALLSYTCWLPDSSGEPAWRISELVRWIEYGPWGLLLIWGGLALLRIRYRRSPDSLAVGEGTRRPRIRTRPEREAKRGS